MILLFSLVVVVMIGALLGVAIFVFALVKLDTNEPLYLDENGNVTRRKPKEH